MTAFVRIERALPMRPARPRPTDRGERLARTLIAHAARAGCGVQLRWRR